MEYFDPLGRAFWATIAVAILCGTIVGAERQLGGKPAGIRTSILICMSTAVFIHLGATILDETGDPTRILGQIVTGVGFLGAGVMLTRDGIVTGVTTAAVIWILAAIGAAVGMGYLLGAVALSVVTVVVLIGIGLLESSIRRLAHGAHESERDKP